MTHGRREDPGAGEAPRFPAWAPQCLVQFWGGIFVLGLLAFLHSLRKGS